MSILHFLPAFNKIPKSCVGIAELLQQSKNPSLNQTMLSSEEIKEGLKRQQGGMLMP